MAKKKAVPSKEAAPKKRAAPKPLKHEAIRMKMTKGYALVRIEFPMGIMPTRKLRPIIAEKAEEHGGRVLDRRSKSGGGGTWSITELEFPSKSDATTAAFKIYLSASEVADRTTWLSFYIEGEKIEVQDEERVAAGSDEMILILVDKYFDEYRKQGGKLGRLGFIEGCLGSSGGVERIYVEEGLTPSWQQLGAWYYE